MLRFLQTLNLSADQVSVVRSNTTRKIVSDVEAAIDHAWQEAARRPGVYLFDGQMCRLESWTVSKNHLSLVLSRCSYKWFFGTNMSNPEFADRYGSQVMANPVGVSPSLLTSDGFLMLGRRNASVAYYPNRLHPFAGSMDPADADPFATVRRELQEEVSLAEADITSLRCSGIVEDTDLRQTEFIFSAVSTLTRREIESKLDRTEHGESWAVAATASDIEAALASSNEFTPVAVAALLLFGRLSFGNEWFNRIIQNNMSPGGTRL